MNQLATPGLGSLMARRYVAGTVQLLLAIAGFCLVIGWFAQLMAGIYHSVSGASDESAHYAWMGKSGALIFILAWLLSWPTTISILREARENEAQQPLPRPIPPKL